MTTQYEIGINRQMEQLADTAKTTFMCNVLPHEVNNIKDYKTDPAMQFHLPLLLAELHLTLEQLLNCGRNTYICCLPVEIDHWDYLVTPSHRTLSEDEVKAKAGNVAPGDYFAATGDESSDNVSDWQFEAWLEKLLRTEVLSVGSVEHEGRRFRTFKWLVQEPSTRTQPSVDGKYAAILSYFDTHPFGSEMPVLTLLSTLPPRDRCAILEVIRAKDPSNVEVYNKLSMAYLKDGQETKARSLLQEGLQSGALDDFTFQQLDEKITFLHANMQMTPQQEAALRAAGAAAPKPSQSYAETIGILNGRYADNASGPFREFHQLLLNLCQPHASR